jgi:hypothetical protein
LISRIGPALRLHASDAGDDVQRLPERMRVPGGTRAGSKLTRPDRMRAGAGASMIGSCPHHAGERFLRLAQARRAPSPLGLMSIASSALRMIAIADRAASASHRLLNGGISTRDGITSAKRLR